MFEILKPLENNKTEKIIDLRLRNLLGMLAPKGALFQNKNEVKVKLKVSL